MTYETSIAREIIRLLDMFIKSANDVSIDDEDTLRISRQILAEYRDRHAPKDTPT